MKFYGRDQELRELEQLMGKAGQGARMAVLVGRRRVGKTLLSLEFVKNRKFLYFFVSKKSEALLCQDYIAEILRAFPNAPVIGDVRSFRDVFQLLLLIARDDPFTLIIDEFQEFFNINPSVYSEIQKLWDLNKARSGLNVICIGSVYSLMHKIFEGAKEPLFNRADRVMTIRPFPLRTMAGILRDYAIDDPRILFDHYLLTGGSPKYIDLLVENRAFAQDEVLNFVVQANSPFLDEGKALLIEEFGKEYGTYFSILELISVGKTGRSEIQAFLGSDIGGYLDRLEKDYAVIEKYKPINARPNARTQKYRIRDNFLAFWFRFIYRERSAVEIGNFEYIREMVRRDYSTYAGPVLERFFQALFAETRQYNRIGSYWEKAHLNEIDLVAMNDKNKTMVIAEVKMNKDRIDLAGLKAKSRALLASYPKYKVEWQALGIEDIGRLLQA